MAELFSGAYKGKTVLVTGHTGFKGSWLTLWLDYLGAKTVGYSRPSPTDPNHADLIKTRVASNIGDILDLENLKSVFQKYQPEIVFHLAAQPLVRLSYEDPVETYQTNVMGTLNVLEAARGCSSVKAFVSITTDKVYENKEWHWGYREIDRLGGYDPYSSSKACAEILLGSYQNSYFNLKEFKKSHNVLLARVRAGNVIGGGDWSRDRLIPDIMKSTGKGDPVVIRNPVSIRPWQHVLECLSGYLMVGSHLLAGDSAFAQPFNFGPSDSDAISVGEVSRHVVKHWPSAQFEFPEKPSGPHEARYLKLDCSLAGEVLGWQPVWNVEKAIERTTRWYRGFYEDNAVQSVSDLEQFISDAQQKGLPWTE